MLNLTMKRAVDALIEISKAVTNLAVEAKRANDIRERQGH